MFSAPADGGSGYPQKFDVYDPGCPSRLVLEHVTSRWGVLVLGVLQERTFRFSELRRRVGGVSEKMLAQTLRLLESDGFVVRHDHGAVPPHVDYTLTSAGAEVASLVGDVVAWIEDNMPGADGAPAPSANEAEEPFTR